MSDKNGTPSDLYEVVWENGHTETIRACQVAWPGSGERLLALPGAELPPPSMRFHDYVEDQWTLVLQVREDAIVSVRNLTRTELDAS